MVNISVGGNFKNDRSTLNSFNLAATNPQEE